MKGGCSTCLFVAVFASVSRAQDAADLWLESYETIWQTVSEHHYDPTYGGVDWAAIHDRYLERVGQAENDEAFLALANAMLGELGLSHYAVFRVDSENDSEKQPEGTAGLITRLLDQEVVVTSLREGFPAAESGLHPGCVIDSIDDVPVDSLMAAHGRKAPSVDDDRRIRLNRERAIRDALFGETGTEVTIAWRDWTDALRRTTLQRVERPGRAILGETLPPFFVDFEAERIAGDIACIRFSMFLPPVDDLFAEAMAEMMDARGLIIDIRGNPGGMHTVGEAIAAGLVAERTLFSIFRYREETREVFVEPADEVFDGPVAVLIDGQNASASERFSGCLQSIGRAVVIGERSCGSVGPSDTIRLPNGATLMYLIAQSLTPDGTVLEGHGVIPDIPVAYDRESLLAGRDIQLERAVEYIRRHR